MRKWSKSAYWVSVYTMVIGCIIAVAIYGTHAITVFQKGDEMPMRTCVIIDAGHGGVDGGTTSCTGVLESHINLEIALRLNDLMHLLGVNTKMIRTTDCSVYTQGNTIAAKKVSDLKQRVSIVNETQNALLVSIHQNYFSQSQYSGAQVFYADNENSKLLAGQVQKQIVNTINNGSKRTAKKASGIYLMEKVNATGILVECGFLSNPQEEALLRDADYQQKLCIVLSCAVLDFIESPNTVS